MKLITNLNEIDKPLSNAVVTIGNFDGVHLGHQRIFDIARKKARSMGGKTVAITFRPHPVKVLKKGAPPPLITDFEQKKELIEKAGIDILICIPFSMSFAAVTAQEFVCDILLKRIGMKAIIVGKDYTFGKNRKGNIDFLKSYGAQCGFEVIVTDWVFTDAGESDRISSTRIREIVLSGEMEKAQKMLGRPFQLRGRVIRGRNRGGRLLGFPTANIELSEVLCPKPGVYAVTVDILENSFHGVANIGFSPTFDDQEFTVEVHIIGFSEDIYGKFIHVNFIRHLRSEIRFSSVDELCEQIKEDIRNAEAIFQADLKGE